MSYVLPRFIQRMAVPRVWFGVLLAVLLSACTSGPPLSPGSNAIGFSFDASPGCAAAGPSPVQLSVSPGGLAISGAIGTGDACPRLSGRPNVSSGEIRLDIETKEPRAPCAPCPGSVAFSARLSGLAPGLYTVRVLADGREIDRQGAYIR